MIEGEIASGNLQNKFMMKLHQEILKLNHVQIALRNFKV